MSTAEQPHIKRRPLLDGSRGVLMWVVLGYHLNGLTRFPGAWVSMDYFFVLSGYLITTLLMVEYTRTQGQTGEGSVSLRRFWIRRIRRLMPSLLLVLTATFVVAGLLGGREEWPDLRSDGFAALFYYANWQFIWSAASYWASFVDPPLRHTWSLAIEEQFYLIWPIVFLGLARVTKLDRRKFIGIMAVLLLLSAWWMRQKSLGSVDLSRAYFGTDTRAQGLVAGVMLALFLWRDRFDDEKWAKRANWMGLVAFGALIAMMFLFAEQDRAVYTNFGFLLVVAVGALLVFACARANSGPMAWIFGNRVSRHFGMVSYPFYLWHWPVIAFLSHQTEGWNPVTWKLLAVAITLVLTELTYWYVEKPIYTQRVRLRQPRLILTGGFATAAMALLLATSGSIASLPPTEGTGIVTSGAARSDTRALVVGDSLAWLVGGGAPKNVGLTVEAMFQAHCDIIGDRIFTGSATEIADPNCPKWPQRWATAVARDPDAVVMITGLRQLFDLDIDGRRVVVGSPEWTERYRAAVRKALTTLKSAGDVPVLVFNVPCYAWANQETDGEEQDARRLRIVNRELKSVVEEFPNTKVIDYASRVCRGKGGTELIPGVRPDGAHLSTEETLALWRWLKPQVLEAANGSG